MYCDIPDFGRCCFCLPLRRGVLVFGYLNAIFSAFMVGVYSYYVHLSSDSVSKESSLLIKGVVIDSHIELCITYYCIEVIVNCLLVYGAHQSKILFVKIFYYYAITTTLVALVLQFVGLDVYFMQDLVLAFTGLCIQLYLIFLVRSLLKKLEIGSSHSYDNQLHNIVVGEARLENGVYNTTTVSPVAKEEY